MQLGLQGKVAIVTGGASGIGAAIVEGFAEEGVNLVIGDIDYDEALRLENRIEAECRNIEISAFGVDVSKRSDVSDLISHTVGRFGRVDILVNNAGIHRNLLLADLTEEDWDKVMDVNAKGVYLTSKAVAPHMIEAKYGKIVNVASCAGKEGFVGHTHYSASKFAVIGITQVLAKELGQYGINVNSVCPGVVRTTLFEAQLEAISRRDGNKKEEVWDDLVALTVLKRPQTPQDIANVILFLSSEVSRNITGEAVNVTGGIRMD